MKSKSLRWSILIAVLSLLASCGGGDGGGEPSACTPNGNISLLSSSTGASSAAGCQDLPVTFAIN